MNPKRGEDHFLWYVMCTCTLGMEETYYKWADGSRYVRDLLMIKYMEAYKGTDIPVSSHIIQQ